MFVCVVSLPNYDKLLPFAYVHKKNSGMPVVNYFSPFFILTNLLSKLAQLSKLGTKRLFKKHRTQKLQTSCETDSFKVFSRATLPQGPRTVS